MKQILILDTETTGVTATDEILQLSIINTQKETIVNEYYKPKKLTEWPMAERVHHISPADVADKPTITQAKKKIEKILNTASIIVGYNIQFDIRMLVQNGIEIPSDIRIIDIMKPFAKIYGEYNQLHKNYKWQKLETCARYYGYKEEGYHNSLADCYATLHCFKEMYYSNQLEELSWQPKFAQQYWTLSFDHQFNPHPEVLNWLNTPADIKNKALRLCYLTKEYCEKNLQQDFKRLTGKTREEYKKYFSTK